MKTRIFFTRLSATMLLAGGILALAACNGSLANGTGSLSLGVTDTPVDGVQSVVVAFTGVTLQGPGGTRTVTFAHEKTVDLAALQGTSSNALLAGTTVTAGQYQWVRLNLDLGNSYIVTSSGTQYPLTIPSGSQTGLKLVSGFTVARGGQASYMIDFNLRKSLTMTQTPSGTTYMLKPALRLINEQHTGTITGSAAGSMSIGSESISDPACSPAVYVFSGTNVTPEGFNVTVPGGTPPLTSATLGLNNATGNYDYTVGFLAAGGYTLAVTCAANDTTAATALTFSAPANATVMASASTTVNFPQ